MFELYHKYKNYVKPVLLIYWILLFTLTTIPSVPMDFGFQFQDKIEHSVAFMILSFIFTSYIYQKYENIKKTKSFFMVIIIIALYAALDELHQPLVGRICDIWDFIFDVLGAILGYFLLLKFEEKR